MALKIQKFRKTLKKLFFNFFLLRFISKFHKLSVGKFIVQCPVILDHVLFLQIDVHHNSNPRNTPVIFDSSRFEKVAVQIHEIVAESGNCQHC